jgi:hypothetical protein
MTKDSVLAQQLHDRIQALSEQQLKAIQDAVYLGMTSEVAKACEARRELIRKLIDQLAALCK